MECFTIIAKHPMHPVWIWMPFEVSENFEFWIWISNSGMWETFQKLSLINTWSKVWEEQTWHSKNIRGNNANGFGFKSEFYLNLKKMDFYKVWILPLEKCSNEREYSPDHFGIYIPYIKYL